MARKTITLAEIRIAHNGGSSAMGRMKLRPLGRATKLRKRLAKRYGIQTVAHRYTIRPNAEGWAALHRMGA